MKPLAKLPRVLQPAKGFNTRRTRQTLTLTRQNPYPSLRVGVLRVRDRVAPENPRVTCANHYLYSLSSLQYPQNPLHQDESNKAYLSFIASPLCAPHSSSSAPPPATFTMLAIR